MTVWPKTELLAAVLLRLSAETAVIVIGIWALFWVAGHRLSARVRYVVWLLVPIRLLLFASVESPLSLFNAAPEIQPRNAPLSSVDLAPAHYDIAPAALSRLPLPTPRFSLILRCFALVWAAGVLIGASWIFTHLIALRRRLSLAPEVADRAVRDLLDEARRLVGCPSRLALYEVAGLPSPALFGHRTILLPAGLPDRCSPAELRCAFVHELAHLKRRDHWAHNLLLLVNLVHWFNPLIWIACRRIRAEMEMASDERAVLLLGPNSRRGYAEALFHLTTAGPSRLALVGFSGFSGPDLKQRLLNLARAPVSRRATALFSILAGCLAVLVLTDRRSASPGRIVEGVVLDAESGLPVTNVSIQALTSETKPHSVLQLTTAQPQDGQPLGHFQLHLRDRPEIQDTALEFAAPGYARFTSITFPGSQIPRHLTVRMHKS